MKKTGVAILLFSFLNVGAALAQTRAPMQTGTPNPAPQVRYQSTTRYDFDNDQVEGTTLRPDGDIVDGVKKGRPTSLVKARQHFTAEMVKSVENQ